MQLSGNHDSGNEGLPDLSIEEIQYLLLDRRRASRRGRLERYRRTGRAIPRIGDSEVIATSGNGSSSESSKTGNRKRSQRTWLDNLLLGLELLAIAALIIFLISGLLTLNDLNRQVAFALRQPTLEPTPIIREVVLPEGHTPPNSPGGARPNEAEIPINLRPIYQAAQNIPIPTPAGGQAIRIQIPAIGVDAPVVQGDGWEQLKKGVAQHIGSADPGENGNVVLSGHNDVYGEVFRDLDRLKPGDVIILFTSLKRYTYVITGTQLVEPTTVEVMAPTPNPAVTLISCHPYLVDIHRIIVKAELQNS